MQRAHAVYERKKKRAEHFSLITLVSGKWRRKGAHCAWDEFLQAQSGNMGDVIVFPFFFPCAESLGFVFVCGFCLE
jgi:hypothetical protein